MRLGSSRPCDLGSARFNLVGFSLARGFKEWGCKNGSGPSEAGLDNWTVLEPKTEIRVSNNTNKSTARIRLIIKILIKILIIKTVIK